MKNKIRKTGGNESKASIADIPDEYFKGKKVFLRVDLNVPVKGGNIGEDFRIRRTIASIDYLVKRGALVILASHLGRPEGKPSADLSLKPIRERLSVLLDRENIFFVDNCTGSDVRNAVNSLKSGDILLLENLRFHKSETDNDVGFARQLSSLAEIYVNDAFSTSHRKHASTYGIEPFFDIKLAGFLVEKEIQILSEVRDNPKRPLVLIIGGAKIKDKIAALKHLIKKADKVILGGGPAYTFLASEGVEVGKSLVDSSFFETVREISSRYYDRILLPIDHVVALDENAGSKMLTDRIPEGYRAMDIGEKTTAVYTHEIMNSNGTIFWNGPMGVFENDEFARGTIDIARAFSIAYWRGARTVVGGGDTTACLRKAEILETEVDFVSTGGGATLLYLSGEEIPGISILDSLKEIKNRF